MRVLLKIALAILITVSLTAEAGTILHKNMVKFTFRQKAPVAFLVTRHSVTDGQPFETTDNAFLPHWFLNEPGMDTTELWIISGRRKSAQVFNALSQWGYNTSGIPGELNFAVEGTLSFTLFLGKTYVCKNIVIAQTGMGLGNLWFVVSKNGVNYSHRLMYTDAMCTTGDGSVEQPIRISSYGDFRTFFIEYGSPEKN